MRILVATDGSERSLRMLPHAGRFARAAGGDLYLTRVLNPRVDLAKDPALHTDEAIEHVAVRWRDELQAHLAEAGLEGTPHVAVRQRGEEIHDIIARTAAELEVSLIAMTSRGAGALRHALLGSTALGVLGQVGLPVAVGGERLEPPPDRPDRLVIASDGSGGAERVVQEIAPLLGSVHLPVTLLRVHVPALGDEPATAVARGYDDDLAALEELLPASAPVTRLVVAAKEFEKLESAIVRAADEQGATAIALATSHAHSVKRHLLTGSTAMGVVGRSPLPVLLARSEK